MALAPVRMGGGRWLPWLTAILVTATFCALTAWVTGPAYLRDEIGYLSNAAFLGGRYVDVASSYYAGYSLLLAPLFYMFDHPATVWRGVMIVNALLWGGTLALLHVLLRRLFPQVAPWQRGLALLLLAAYPANLAMSSYAFSQSAVAFVFTASVVSLLSVDAARPRTVLLHAALVGFLAWLHPIGMVLPVVSWLALLPSARAARRYQVLLLHVAVSMGLLLVYRYGVEPWRIAGMTAAGAEASLHYPRLQAVGSALLSPRAWLTVSGSLLGQLAYTAVASFGVTLVAAVAITRLGWARATGTAAAHVQADQVRWYVLLAPLACIAATALTTANGLPTRMDHWLYGRYQDAFILPLLGYGLLSERRRWLPLLIAGAVLLIGLWLSYGLHASGPPNRVNFSGLWPEPFLQGSTIAVWLAWGAAGILAFALLPRTLAWIGALLLYAVSTVSQIQWHRMVLNTHSKPSEIVDFVRGNFANGCVYFDTASIPAQASTYSPLRERALLYSYYFFNYRYQQGEQASQWASADCPGALLSYDGRQPADNPALSIVGKEGGTGLRVWVKQDPASLRYPPKPTNAEAQSDWVKWMSPSCLRGEGCIYRSAAALAQYTQVGQLRGAEMSSDGRAGFLFFGPYRPLPAGHYQLQLSGRMTASPSAYVDVVAQGARQVIMKQPLVAPAPSAPLGMWNFELAHDVADVQVRLWVGEGAEVAVSAYTLTRMDQDAAAP